MLPSPEDIVSEILVRVPVKSLVRCKSVCMAWLSIISSPRFIKYHLSHANENPRLLIVQNPISVAPSGIISCDENIDRVVLPSLFHPDSQVVGCCNGIICLATCKCADVVYLWNPLIRQFKKLTAPPMGSSLRCITGYGFGYYYISDDYKVIRILNESDKSDDLDSLVQVYSSNASCWREFPAPVPKKFKLSRLTYVGNNVLYFVCKHSQVSLSVTDETKLFSFDLHEEVFSFDLYEEVFGLVPFHNFIKKGMRSELLDFQGSVAVMIGSINDGLGFDLWTLDDVCGQMSWTKKFSIGAPDGIIVLWSYVGAGRFHGFKYNNIFQDILYDYEKKETIYFMLTEDQNGIVYDYEKGETIDRELTLGMNVRGTEKYIQTLVSLDGFQIVRSYSALL